MQVSITATGGLERRLEVAVPAERVDNEVTQRLKHLSRTARLKGFRPGKAPLEVIRKQFGRDVHAEVVGELMRSSFAEAVNQENLRPAAGPRIEPLAIEQGVGLRYAAVFEVLPEVRLKSFDGIRIERPVATIEESDLDAMVESMRKQRPVFTEVARASQASDRVTMDYEGRIAGEVFQGGEGRDAAVVIGAGQIMPELDAALTGAAAGEERRAQVSFPAEHANQAFAGKTADFTLRVKKVEEQSLPPLDEEFFRAFGVEDGGFESFRAEVRRGLERELAERIRERLRNQVLDALCREHPLELPQALVEEQIQQLQIDVLRRMGAKEVKEAPPREPFEEPARRRVLLGLILGEIIRSENLKPDRTRVQEHLAGIVSSYPDPEAAHRTIMQSAESMRQVEHAVLEQQAIEKVIERAQIEERPTSFRDLTGFGAETP